MKKYDAIIIGFGKGGKTLAGYLAGQGRQVALVEKSRKMYGGTCINVGCIPSKSLISNAMKSERSGLKTFEEKARLYAKAVQEKRQLVAMLNKKNYDKLAENENIAIYDGVGSFESQRVVKVIMEHGTEILEGEHIFINTGSIPVVPKIEGIQNNKYVYFSETIMDMEQLPKRLVVIGGGYIGLEFAAMYANYGSQVTVIQDGESFIPREDADIASVIRQMMEDKGIAFRLSAQIHGVEAKAGFAEVAFSHEGKEYCESAEAVLVATGRRPNTDGLNLEAAGVEVNQRGAVVTDENRRTAVPNIWAMGDVVGGSQFTYISLDDFRIVRSQFGGASYSERDRKNVPYSVFLDPAFSRVGLNEREAIAAGCEVKIAKLPAAAIPKAQVLKHPVGMLKAVINSRTNKILGAMLICEESYEMINIIKLAMDCDADYTVLRDQIFTHPTMSEALNDLFAV